MKIRIVEFDGLRPAPAYTDYSAVYVSNTLMGEQRRTALRHERAHIWLQHQTRGMKLKEELGGAIDRQAWNIAADLEIAKHIYTQRDDDAITAIRSALAGGIRLRHCAEYPSIQYAEEYYTAIMEAGVPDGAMSLDGDASDDAALAESSPGRPLAAQGSKPEVLIEATKSLSDEASDADSAAESAQQTQRSIAGFKPPPPSLASLVDMHIGRSARTRADSYRRPSRRKGAFDFIAKGAITKQKAPRITIYVDRSGSFSPVKTAASVKALAQCLMKYRGRVDCDVIYFADQLMRIDPRRGVGGTNYQPVIDQIAADMSNVSVIITDADSADGVVVPLQMPPVVVMPIDCHVTNIGKLLCAQHAHETA